VVQEQTNSVHEICAVLHTTKVLRLPLLYAFPLENCRVSVDPVGT